MKAEDLMAKATIAATSAQVLLEMGDADGACNRAYYAMFDAARAALLSVGHDVGKTHRSVLSAFSERFVKDGPLPRETGRLLKHAETIRCVADYLGDPIDTGEARRVVAYAQDFIATISNQILASPPPSP